MVLLLRLIPSAGHDKLLLTYGLALALGAGWPFEQAGLNANLGALLIGMVLAGEPLDHTVRQAVGAARGGRHLLFLPIAQAALGQETAPNL